MLIFAILVLWKYEVSQTFTEGIKKHSSVFLILSANWGDRPKERKSHTSSTKASVSSRSWLIAVFVSQHLK